MRGSKHVNHSKDEHGRRTAADTTLRKTKNGNDSETNKGRGSAAWDTNVTGGSSVLFGRATDTFLVPYLLSVQAEGGRFDFGRWQNINGATKRERVALEQKVLAYQTIVEEAGLSPEEAASVNLLIGRTGLTGSDTFAIGKMGAIPEIVRYLDAKRKESGLRILDTSTIAGRAGRFGSRRTARRSWGRCWRRSEFRRRRTT